MRGEESLPNQLFVCREDSIGTMTTYQKCLESNQKIFGLGLGDSNAAGWDFLVGVLSIAIATENTSQFI